MSAKRRGDEELYSVRSGEAWRCGRHVFACSDLLASSLFEEVLRGSQSAGEGRAPALVYADPPWNQALANGFRTRSGLGRADYDWTELYRGAARIADLLRVPLWADGSAADTADGMRVPGSIARSGGTRRGYWPTTYFGGRPAGLYYAHTEPPPSLELAPNSGFQVVAQVLAVSPPGAVVDPFGGLGGVPLEAERAGRASLSNELNPSRVSAALARMGRMTGLEPERLD